MNITQKDRSALKAYFVTDAVPTEQQFAELIDGMVNQRGDGLVKLAGNPLAIEATGDSASAKPALDLYRTFTDADPEWSLRLNPRADPADPATARRGLSIGDPSGTSRLFIDHGTGNVGIGTVDPQAALHVRGRAIIEQQEEWREFNFQNGWSAHGDYVFDGQLHAPARYMKDSMGFVRFTGRIKAGNAGHNTVICTVDEGYRPQYRSVWVVYSANLHGAGTVDVCPDGKVRVGLGIVGSVNLGTICYQPAPPTS